MADKGSAGQADKAAAEAKTADVADDPAARAASTPESTGVSASASDDPQNPYPNYDFMTLEDLQSLADERGVEVNRDVLKAHLITELRAADSGTVSPAVRRGAR